MRNNYNSGLSASLQQVTSVKIKSNQRVLSQKVINLEPYIDTQMMCTPDSDWLSELYKQYLIRVATVYIVLITNQIQGVHINSI